MSRRNGNNYERKRHHARKDRLTKSRLSNKDIKQQYNRNLRARERQQMSRLRDDIEADVWTHPDMNCAWELSEKKPPGVSLFKWQRILSASDYDLVYRLTPLSGEQIRRLGPFFEHSYHQNLKETDRYMSWRIRYDKFYGGYKYINFDRCYEVLSEIYFTDKFDYLKDKVRRPVFNAWMWRETLIPIKWPEYTLIHQWWMGLAHHVRREIAIKLAELGYDTLTYDKSLSVPQEEQ